MSKKPTIIRPPSQLSKKSKGLWKSILTEFELEPESLELLRIGLENLDLGDRARGMLRVEGLVLGAKPHPASNAVKLHDGLHLRCMRQLGLDVVAPGSKTPLGRRT